LPVVCERPSAVQGEEGSKAGQSVFKEESETIMKQMSAKKRI